MSIFNRISICILIPLFFLYEINRMYPKDPIIDFSTLFVFLFFFFSLREFLFCKEIPFRNSLARSFFAIGFLFVFLTYEHSLFDPLSSIHFYLTIPIPLFLFFLSYNYTKIYGKSLLPDIAFCGVCIFSVVYLVNQKGNINELLDTDSGSYTILYFIPFLFCLKNSLTKTIGLLLASMTVLLSFKRGGIICLFLGFYVYALVWIIKGNDWISRLKKFFISLVPLFCFVLLFVSVNNFFDDYIFYRFSMIEESGGSGRDLVYKHTIEMIANSSWSELLVGHGWNAVFRDSFLALSAHNDFLECLYDYGIVVFLFYVLLYVNLIRLFVDMLKHNSLYSGALASSLVIFLSNSLVSHIFILYDWYAMIFTLFWGFILAAYQQEQEKNRIK